MSDYALIYSDSKTKINPLTLYVDLYDVHLQLNPNNINKP